MRVLIIAYEFPPSPSPQSLRWTYLSRELALLGHEVHVLTADLGGTTPGLPDLPASVRVHRSFPGLIRGALAFHRAYRDRHPRTIAQPVPATEPDQAFRDDAPLPQLRPPRNWKQRVSEAIQGVAAKVHFPDIRGEWRFWGRRALRRLVRDLSPDVVVSSHEPATTLELGLSVRRPGMRWVVDLGDPVLAPYTPRRWRRRSQRLERLVCRHADAILVTSDATRTLLQDRHGQRDGIHVLTQGFDATTRGEASHAAVFSPDRLELLYTGSLYSFRRIDRLLEAVAEVPGVRLSIASVTVPESILRLAQDHPEQVRLLGFLPHRVAIALQKQADVLVNLANADAVQVPGKFYEYLGSSRPILHIGDPLDPVAVRVAELKRGWTCSLDTGAIATCIRALAEARSAGLLEQHLDLGLTAVEASSWTSLGKRLAHILESTVHRHSTPR